MLIDSHAHLTNDRFADDLGDVVTRASEAGVSTIVTIGNDLDDSRAAARLAASSPNIYAAVGIHPNGCAEAPPGAMAEVEELARNEPRVVAIGETGLDYYYDRSPAKEQRAWFSRHLELATSLELPVVVHCREADDDLQAMIREAGPTTTGVLHCFASGAPLMEAALELGWFISFSGMVTFANYDATDLLRAVPLDRLLVETDSPYLSPVPNRGKRNEPAYVALVAARAAELRGEDPDALALATVRNTRTLYHLEV